jgi:hypothetical protein
MNFDCALQAGLACNVAGPNNQIRLVQAVLQVPMLFFCVGPVTLCRADVCGWVASGQRKAQEAIRIDQAAVLRLQTVQFLSKSASSPGKTCASSY